MGHVGQELRFVARGDLELAVGLFQLLGALSHPGFQLFGMLSDLLVESGVLDGDGRLIRQGAQELSVLLAETSAASGCTRTGRRSPCHAL